MFVGHLCGVSSCCSLSASHGPADGVNSCRSEPGIPDGIKLKFIGRVGVKVHLECDVVMAAQKKDPSRSALLCPFSGLQKRAKHLKE